MTTTPDNLMESTRMFSSSLFLWILCCLIILPTTSVVLTQDYTCNVLTDQCPTRNNGKCESSLSNTPSNNPFCRNGDCLDCNYLCTQYDSDCTGCLSAVGCFWCPGDATCNNSPYYSVSATTSCNDSTAYVAAPNTGQCPTVGTLFK